jgi:hypothetical protein
VGLREIAAADLKSIVEDSAGGFGWLIKVTDPDTLEASLVGFSNDVSQTIDPDTGQAVSGRIASVALAIASLTAAGLGLPRGISDKTSKPWIVMFNDIGGTAHTFKVRESMPDRALGIVVCTLEAYRA